MSTGELARECKIEKVLSYTGMLAKLTVSLNYDGIREQ